MVFLNRTSYTCLYAACFFLTGAVYAQAVYMPSAYKANFGDGLQIEKYKTGYYDRYKDADNYSGYEYSRNQFRWNNWTGRGEQLAYVSKAQDASGDSHSVSLGVNNLDAARALWTADASFTNRFTPNTVAELGFNRDRVEVQPSLVSNVFANAYSASLEQQIETATRVQVTYGETYYTDGNRRPQAKIKATYDAWPELGISLQFRGRYFRNTDTAVSSGYFNPYKFVENIAAVEVNKSVAGWALSGDFGYGRQAGGHDPLTLAKAFEISATTPIANRVFVRAKAGYFRSLGYSGPDFIYRYVSEDVVVVF